VQHLGRLTTIGIGIALGLALAAPVHGAYREALEEGDRAFDREEWDRAARAYDRAIRSNPTQVPAEAYGKRAAIHNIKGDYEDALRFTTAAETRWPGAPEILEQKAVALWQLGSKPDAVRIAEEVVAKRPSVYSMQAILGEFFTPREPDKSIAANEAYLQHRPRELAGGDMFPRLRLGLMYLEKGRTLPNHQSPEAMELWAKAEEQFQAVLRNHRGSEIGEINAGNGLCAAYTIQRKFSQAITTCERLIQNPRHIDLRGAVWHNLAVAYLNNRQARRARTAANEFIRMRRNDPRGYIIVGDAYFHERDWDNALRYYQDAERIAQSPRDQARLNMKMGLVFRRLDRMQDAISKLEAALEAQPYDVTLVTELGAVYLSFKQDTRALSTVERIISDEERFGPLQPSEQAQLLVVSAKAHYNQQRIAESRARYEAANALREGRDVQIRNGLVQTVNMQAHQSFMEGKTREAERLLAEAHAIHPRAPITNQNMAVLALDAGKCDEALKQLSVLRNSRPHALMYHRLSGRALLCAKKPNRARAAEHYAAADKIARSPDVRANLVRAEIYAEWAPLTWRENLDDSIEKLETAVQFSVQNRQVGDAARRNLALALFQRGWRHMRAGRSTPAAEDFSRALREPALLRGTEELAFEFSHALALLDKGDTAEAAKLFRALAGKGRAGSYLKAPYDRVGNEFFSAYAKYRTNSAAQRREAANEFAKMQGNATGAFGNRVRDLAASSWEHVAWHAYRDGNAQAATAALDQANRLASSAGMRRNITHNRAVLQLGTRGAPAAAEKAFQELGNNPPEALANLGIVYDRQGKAREAYDAWNAARGRGVRDSSLNDWIDAKKRIFGF
jgi:tetratricopeptide (TPR) repeat protein